MMTGYVLYAFDASKDLIAKIQKNIDSYWTPWEGHKIGIRSTREKLRDWLLIAESSQRCSVSPEEELLWFQLECQLFGMKKDIE